MRPRILSPRSRDLVLAVALMAGALVEAAVGVGSGSVAIYLWAVATTLPLALRSVAPVTAGLGVQLAFVVGTPVVAAPDLLAQGVAVFLVATYVAAVGAPSWAASVSCGLASVGLLALQGVLDPEYGAAGAVVANCIYVAMTWAVAAAVRVQVERSRRSVLWAESAVQEAVQEAVHEAVEEAAEEARAAAADERARLARELHDVLGHSISAMVLRARGGVHEHELDPARSLEALRDVEAVGTRALADVRTLLELDDDRDRPVQPLPGLGDLEDLLEVSRRSGMAVQLRVEGEPHEVSDGLGLTVYRLVQESLTNVMRHSGAREARVQLTWSGRDLGVRVVDEGPGESAPGGGRGLVGISQRVTMLGGEVGSGPRSGGGFEVWARIPLGV